MNYRRFPGSLRRVTVELHIDKYTIILLTGRKKIQTH